MGTPLRIDPEQRFACAQCGRCCRGFEVVVSEAEVEFYRRRHAAAWFRDPLSVEIGSDPFEAIPAMPGLMRIRQRADGACGFLSDTNRCRIHEELGAASKPLTCRLFPYSFHAANDAVIVSPSFSCPTIVANTGPPAATGDSLIALEALRKEWFARHPWKAPLVRLIHGRSIDGRSVRILRDCWTAMLKRDEADIRVNIRRIAASIEDLTRSRVIALSDEDLAQYIALTLPHAAAKSEPVPPQHPGVIARLLQRGFLSAVAAIRAERERPGQSRLRSHLLRLRLLAHAHGLAPALGRVNVRALSRTRIDINAPEIRPGVEHYLRSTVETLGAGDRSIVDQLSIGVSLLNAALALAVMNADAAGVPLDRATFHAALVEAADASHARSALLDWTLTRLSGGADALWLLADA